MTSNANVTAAATTATIATPIATVTTAPIQNTVNNVTNEKTQLPSLKRNTFGALWFSLRNCYLANGRDLQFAYGYISCIETLYANTLRDTIVRKVFLTNAPIDRSEKRDALIRTATNESTFYAILTLLPGAELRLNSYDSNDWLNESKLFGSNFEKSKLIRALTNDDFIRRMYTRGEDRRSEYRSEDIDDNDDDDVNMYDNGDICKELGDKISTGAANYYDYYRVGVGNGNDNFDGTMAGYLDRSYFTGIEDTATTTTTNVTGVECLDVDLEESLNDDECNDIIFSIFFPNSTLTCIFFFQWITM